MSVSTISRRNTKWTALDTVTCGQDVQQSVSLPSWCTEVLVEYGMANGAQAYGGGTIVLNRISDKPCFLPMYLTTVDKFMVYIHMYNQSSVICKNLDYPHGTLFRVYGR